MNSSTSRPSRSLEELKACLRGAIAFPITPYTEDGSVDVAAVQANAAWIPRSGIAAIVAPSGTGELFGLSPEEAMNVTKSTVEAVGGAIPVIASVGYGPRVASEMASRAEQAGADGVLVLPPYYAQPDPDALVNYYKHVADSISIGVIPYARDSAKFAPEQVVRLARDIPNLIAFKDGSSDIRLFQRIREQVTEQVGRDRLVWLAGVGDDLVAPYFASGAEGFTSSIACFWPEASVELYRLASSGEFVALREYHHTVVRPFYELRQRGRGFEVSVMKAAMEILGHPAGSPRPPIGDLSEQDLVDLRAIVAGLDIPDAASRLAELASSVRGS